MKTSNKIIYNKVFFKKYPLNNIFTSKMLALTIHNFWNDIFRANYTEKKKIHLSILTKIEFYDAEGQIQFGSLSELRKVNITDEKKYSEMLCTRLELVLSHYIGKQIETIEFGYLFRKGVCEDDPRLLPTDYTPKNLTSHRFNNMALPISMNPEECGKIVSTTDNQDGSQQVIVDDGKRVFSFSINSSKTQNTVSLLAGAELSWIDTKLEGGGHNSFIREIGKSTIVFLDGEAIVRKQELAGKPFRSGGGNSKFKHTAKFFNTFDIETRNEDGLLIPYLYNGYLNGEHFSLFCFI